MGSTSRYVYLALIFGFLALGASQARFWEPPQPGPGNRGPLVVLFEFLRQALVPVHDSLGTPLTVGVLVLAALVCCWQAIRASN